MELGKPINQILGETLDNMGYRHLSLLNKNKRIINLEVSNLVNAHIWGGIYNALQPSFHT